MSAQPAIISFRDAVPADRPALPGRRPETIRPGLCALLAATAHADPARIAFVDPADKAGWSGRRPITWTYGAAAEIVARLANGLKQWRLPPASRVGLVAAPGSETLLSYLAIEAAGHIPCLLPLAWDEDTLVAGIQAAGIQAVLTQSRVAGMLPAECLCRAAFRYFGLRYLAAFGPDVPDGVISLDGMVLDGRGGPFAPGSAGLVTFAAGDPARPIYRPADALIAAIAVHLATTRIAPGERILSLLAPADLRGLVTGLGAALVAGAGLEMLGPFDAVRLAEALALPGPTHLVVPAALERNLAASRCPDGLHSITLAHRLPTRLPARLLTPDAGRGPRWVVDVLAFDETALLTISRADGDLAHLLADPHPPAPFPTLLDIVRGEDGRFAFRGHASKASPLQRGIPPEKAADLWDVSAFAVTIFAGRATGIARR
ncbi:AMP-binding protein [Methylobacterium sp. 77]|uniref:AMP-binding protein n=1 Tax=Methylobacterium sp. 77 TaxID=1101192 RepID=UPI00036C720B|nr:AMP-binding protein [Methylobacterium sp. 77]